MEPCGARPAILVASLLWFTWLYLGCAQLPTKDHIPVAVFNNTYTLYLTPLNFTEAVYACANSPYLPGPGLLLPSSELGAVFLGLSVWHQELLADILTEVTEVVNTLPREQDGWDMWTFDPDRPCRASSYIFGEAFLISDDRPCGWRTCFTCILESDLRRGGWAASSEWLLKLQAAQALPASALGGGALQQVQLVQSNLVIGATSPPAESLFYNGTTRFLESGPLVTMLSRSAQSSVSVLAGLVPVHFGDHTNVTWDPIRYRTPPAVPYIGEDAPQQQTASFWWEGNNVDTGWNDFVVQVQGCMRNYTVEKLLFITRTGRRMEHGRGTCTYTFSESAPSGGYLAGLHAYYTNSTISPPNADPYTYIYIHQLRLVWAAPQGSGPDTLLNALSVVASEAPCSGARALMETRPDDVSECGPSAGRVCPSNRCCGDTTFQRVSGQQTLSCGAILTACKVSCKLGWGLCGNVPEQATVQYIRYTPSGPMVYIINTEGLRTYAQALEYCATSVHMGLKWSLIDMYDALTWPNTLEMRLRGMLTLQGRLVWVNMDPETVAAAPSYGCLRVVYGARTSQDTYTHGFYPSSCLTSSLVICKAQANQNTTTVGVPATANPSAGTGPQLFAAGSTTLSLSRSIGTPLSGSACSFRTLMSIPLPANSSSQQPTSTLQSGLVADIGGSSGPTVLQAQISLPISEISVSMAVAVFDEEGTEATELVSGITMASGRPPVAQPAMGRASSGGWHKLQLLEGETVTAISGCYGGFVERLVFHTSYGRLWAAPLTQNSLCSVPFLEQAPQGGFLAGLQGVAGYYLEQLQAVWAHPHAAAALSPPATPPVNVLPQPSGLPSNYTTKDSEGGSSLSAGAIAGIAIGAAAGMLLIACVALLLLKKRRQRHGPTAKAPAVAVQVSKQDDATASPSAAASPPDSPPCTGKPSPMAGVDSLTLSAAAVGGSNDADPLQPEPRTGKPSVPTSSDEPLRCSATLVDPAAASQPFVRFGDQLSSVYGSNMNVPAFPGMALGRGSGAESLKISEDLPKLQFLGTALLNPPHVELETGTVVFSSTAKDSPASTNTGDRRMHKVLRRDTSSIHQPGSSHGLNAALSMDVVLVPMQGEDYANDPLLNLVLGRDVQMDETSYLGHGASGVVRRGVLHTEHGDIPVAVKLLNAPMEQDDHGDQAEQAAARMPHLKTLAQEIRVLSRLDHPNIIRFYGGCLDPCNVFIVEELMVTSLNKLIHAKSKDSSLYYDYGLPDVLMLSRDVAAGLAYLHPTVVHRDLKPGNILLNEIGNAKIGDFGLARFKVNTVLSTREVEVGTAPYLAPEVFLASEAKVTDRADVYSLGVIMWELVMRKRPWEGVRNVVIGFKVAMEKQRPPLPPSDHPLCPPPLRNLIDRCWRHNAEERPSSSEIVKKLTLMLSDVLPPASNGTASNTRATPVMQPARGNSAPMSDGSSEPSAAKAADPA